MVDEEISGTTGVRDVNFLDTRVYRWLEAVTDFFLLNLLWLLACLPVVTIFPSTAAMFGVVRDRVRGKDPGLLRNFVSRFRENFLQSLAIGAVWTLFGFALFLDFYVAGRMPTGAEIVMKSLLVLAAFLYAFTSVFLFPVMVHYETGWTGVIKNSLLLSIGRLPTTLVCLLFALAMAGLTFVVPLTVLITGSLTASVVYRLCDREFEKVDSITGRD